MTDQEWQACWALIRGSWPLASLGDPVVEASWRAGLDSTLPSDLAQAIRGYALRADRPTLAGLMVAYAEVYGKAHPRIAAPIPDPAPTGDAWEANYQANLIATQRQLEHERTCGACTTFAQPPPGKERRGRPCPVGMGYWEPHFRAGMGRP